MATQTETKLAADYSSCQIKAAEALLPLLTAADAMDSMTEAELTAFSKVMRAINKSYGAIRTKFDANLMAQVESGKVQLGPVDGSKRTGLQPVRAPRSEDAAKPGRKVTPKTDAEKLAELMAVD